MASIATNAVSRGFRTSALNAAAQNFTMPALSPTMTEGNIASWKVKEGDSFSAGDVLLEIETDKASMDVEAQDDGIVAKIIQNDGAKGVKVGSRIGVLAESGDDLSSLEIPPEEESSTPAKPARTDRPSPQSELSSGLDKTESSPSAAEAPPSSKPNADADAGGAADTASAKRSGADESSASKSSGGRAHKQKYPLYPSVEHLLHENGLSEADADKIPASGPNGRLLKGDVLAYMGRIERNYSAEQSKRITSMGHLDLSNIKLAAPRKAEPKATRQAVQEAPMAEPDLEVAMPVSFAAVIATQRRIQDTLGIFLPISTFIARASELANDDLPKSKTAKPTSEELFNAVLGLDKVSSKVARGHFVPQITSIPSASLSANLSTSAKKSSSSKSDIIDLLTSKRPTSPKPSKAMFVPGGAADATNVFSVSVPKGDAKRAQVFLERIKR
ncbi:hypothetical protein B0A49_05065, partial [Cryomyces minteri]